MKLQTPTDIPSFWKVLKARKKTNVTIRESKVAEEFIVTWQESVLVSDPVTDLIITQPNGEEYPCKKDIFYETYTQVAPDSNFWIKKEITTLVQVPVDTTVSIETLEGTLNNVSYPDFVVIGKRGELYANTKEWADNNLEFLID